jgi:hypothetical protein
MQETSYVTDFQTNGADWLVNFANPQTPEGHLNTERIIQLMLYEIGTVFEDLNRNNSQADIEIHKIRNLDSVVKVCGPLTSLQRGLVVEICFRFVKTLLFVTEHNVAKAFHNHESPGALQDVFNFFGFALASSLKHVHQLQPNLRITNKQIFTAESLHECKEFLTEIWQSSLVCGC